MTTNLRDSEGGLGLGVTEPPDLFGIGGAGEGLRRPIIKCIGNLE